MNTENQRTFFGSPARWTTTSFYPNKMNLDEFLAHIRANISGFEANMKKASPSDDPLGWLEPKHIERWTEMFLAWSEIEQKIEGE